MLKSVGKAAALLLLPVCAAAISGLVTYNVTVNILKKQAAEAAKPAVAEQTAKNTAAETAEETAGEPSAAEGSLDCYVVRLEDGQLGVYALLGGKEEFLYSEPVAVCDLSADDEKLLEGGVRLKDSSELTGFMENFTS